MAAQTEDGKKRDSRGCLLPVRHSPPASALRTLYPAASAAQDQRRRLTRRMETTVTLTTNHPPSPPISLTPPPPLSRSHPPPPSRHLLRHVQDRQAAHPVLPQVR
jgi:hypothetical protein